jgi:polygalacturonase
MKRAHSCCFLSVGVLVGSFLAGASPAAADVTPSPAPGGPPFGLPTATGAPLPVTPPSVPAVCQQVQAQLSTSNGLFPGPVEAAPPDTTRIQAALDACAGSGKAVDLVATGASNAFLSGPLFVKGDEYLLVDAGATLYASRNAGDYQKPGDVAKCGYIASQDNGCYALINMDGSNSGVIGTRAPNGNLGTIDGRGWATIINGEYDESWWALGEQAKSGGKQNNPMLINGYGVNDVTIYQVDLTDSPFFHILIQNGTGLTVWGIEIDTPAVGARNTDGIDPKNETDVVIAHDMVQDGDDCVAFTSDPGTPTENATVEDVHCYGTHGISIGSPTAGGLSNILVRDVSLDGYDSFGNQSTDDNGIRIKSEPGHGGVVHLVTYEQVCMTGVEHPLFFTPHYSSSTSTQYIPIFQDIVVDGLRATGSPSPTSSLFEGYSASEPLQIELAHVILDNTTQSSQNAYVQARVDDSNIIPAGMDVTVTSAGEVPGHVPHCVIPPFGPPPPSGPPGPPAQ